MRNANQVFPSFLQKLASLMLIALLTISITACGSSNTDQNTDSKEESINNISELLDKNMDFLEDFCDQFELIVEQSEKAGKVLAEEIELFLEERQNLSLAGITDGTYLDDEIFTKKLETDGTDEQKQRLKNIEDRMEKLLDRIIVLE